jgi:hypothetical protein
VAVREGILERFPDAEIALAIVWVGIRRGDDGEAAREASTMFDDPRVNQVYDPTLVTSRVFVHGMIDRPPAWDMYLFFAPGERWELEPPRPVDWFHQLSGGRGAPERFRTGADLVSALSASMDRQGFSRRPR